MNKSKHWSPLCFLSTFTALFQSFNMPHVIIFRIRWPPQKQHHVSGTSGSRTVFMTEYICSPSVLLHLIWTMQTLLYASHHFHITCLRADFRVEGAFQHLSVWNHWIFLTRCPDSFQPCLWRQNQVLEDKAWCLPKLLMTRTLAKPGPYIEFNKGAHIDWSFNM